MLGHRQHCDDTPLSTVSANSSRVVLTPRLSSLKVSLASSGPQEASDSGLTPYSKIRMITQSGGSLMGAVAAKASWEGLPDFLGIRILSAEQACVVGELNACHKHSTAQGRRVHGGVVMALADTLGAIGTVLNLPSDCTTSTIESKTNFLAAGELGILRGTAEPLHLGRTTMVWQTTVRNESGRRLALVTQTQLVMPASQPSSGDSRVVPVPVKSEMPRATAAERRSQIFAAASEVLARKGYAQTTVRDIADAARMPVPTMYQYIKSKEDILALVFDTYMAEIRAAVEKARQTPGSARERLAAVISANLSSYDRYHRQLRLMHRETQMLSAHARHHAMARTREVIDLIAEVIEEGVQSGEFRQVSSQLTANFIPMICATWTLRYWNVKHHGFAAVRDALVQLVLDGVTSTSDIVAKPVRSSRPKRRRE